MKVYLNGFSNAPLRVRIALAMKGLSAEEVSLDLESGGGEQHAAAFLRINPQGMIPVLEDEGRSIVQSLAIIEYLEERHPSPPLMPRDAAGRARVRGLAMCIACDAQPLVNLRVRRYLVEALRLPPALCADWVGHWMRMGFGEYESLLARDAPPGSFSHGTSPTMADAVLVPQVLMARRFGVVLDGFPRALSVFDATMALDAVRLAVDRMTPATV